MSALLLRLLPTGFPTEEEEEAEEERSTNSTPIQDLEVDSPFSIST